MDDTSENPSAELGASPVVPPPFEPPPPPVPPRPLSYWLRKFFACNPFYLVSAALLLCGVYLVSADDTLLHREIFQLTFNFSSLQLYEGLLVVTAIVLSRQRIWYDSLLLVSLENMLVFVPFILISQAALLDPKIVWIICAVGGLAAAGRFWGLKRFIRELNLPRRALVFGLVLLVINVALPLIFRHLHESKVGTKPTDGAAYEFNRYSWLVLLPAMFALINLLPRPAASGELLPQRRWWPMGLFSLWLAASGVHLYSLSYVYNFDFEPAFKVPLLWVALWSICRRHREFFRRPVVWLERILLVPPALITLLVADHDGRSVFLALTILNLAIYTFVLVKNHGNRTALFLLFATVQALFVGLFPQSTPEKLIATMTAAFLLFWVMRSRNPKAGLLGFLIISFAGIPFADFAGAWSVTFQMALAFQAIHSLRWNDSSFDARAYRIFLAVGWIGHAFFIVHSEAVRALPSVYGVGAFTMVVCVLTRLFNGSWKSGVVPIAAGLVLLAQPGDWLVKKMLIAPVGLLVVAGSFLVFAVGTWAALTKSRWNHPPPATFPTDNKSELMLL